MFLFYITRVKLLRPTKVLCFTILEMHRSFEAQNSLLAHYTQVDIFHQSTLTPVVFTWWCSCVISTLQITECSQKNSKLVKSRKDDKVVMRNKSELDEFKDSGLPVLIEVSGGSINIISSFS